MRPLGTFQRLRTGGLALGLALASACAEPTAPRPNVLLITLDTTRADHLSCYGYELPTSPSLDALAAEGVRFERCMATASLTPVSHASILTGLNPYRHGLRVLHAATGYRLPDDVPTLATELKRAGYSTAAFLSAFPVSERFGLQRGFDVYDSGCRGEREPPRERAPLTALDQREGATQRRSDATIDAALDWLGTAREPWFVWIHLWDPHDPTLVPPQAAVARFVGACPPGRRRSVDVYDVEIHFMDAQIGRLLERLRAGGGYDSTAVVVTADHGQGLGEHGWASHRILYEEQLHVPLIVRAPGLPSGSSVGALVRTIDVYPTVLECLDLGAAATYEGRSLLALARGEPDAPRLAYADALNKWDTRADMLQKRPADDLLHCLMDERWKLIYRPLRQDESELYDLELDRDEARNLYRASPASGRPLLDELDARRPWVLAPLGAGDLDGDAAEALRELGYLGGEDEGK